MPSQQKDRPVTKDTVKNDWEGSPQICDILITGGDTLMSRDKTLKNILKAVLRMARIKRIANGKKGSAGKGTYLSLQ